MCNNVIFVFSNPNLSNFRKYSYFTKTQYNYFAQMALKKIFKYSVSQKRQIKSSTQFPTETHLSTKQDWRNAINEGGEIVRYSNSLSKLQQLLITKKLDLRKIVGSSHPALHTIKQLLSSDNEIVRPFGIIVLLMSKVFEQVTNGHIETDEGSGILQSQRLLADSTELIRASYLIQKTLVNLQPFLKETNDSNSYKSLISGNKICLLFGDYLLAQYSVYVSSLRNNNVFELMTSTIRDFSESEFIGERDEHNNELPFKPNENKLKVKAMKKTIEFNNGNSVMPFDISNIDNAEKEWEYRNILNTATLLGKACQSTLILAQKSEDLQRQAYLFGMHLSLARQASMEIDPFRRSNLPKGCTFSLVSAPILFHLEHDPSIFVEIEKGKMSAKDVNYEKLHKAIISGPSVNKAIYLQRKHSLAAIQILESFPQSDARNALKNIILSS